MTKRLVLLALPVTALIGLFATGLHREVDAESLGRLVESAGWAGPALFILLFGLQGLGVPALLYLGIAIALWPPWLAFAFCWAGSLVAGCVGFAYARGVGRDWIAERLPERMRRFESQIVERSLRTVIVFRLLFFLATPAHWALGLSPVGFGPFLLGSAIGLLPGIALYTLAGSAILEWYEGRGTQLAVHSVALLVIGALAFWLWRRVRGPGINEPT